MSDGERPALGALADRLGIVPEYVDCTGAHRVTSHSAREALVAAMGYEVTSEAQARQALADLERQQHAALLDPLQVVTVEHEHTPVVRLRLPGDDHVLPVEYHLRLRSEDGRVHELQGRQRVEGDGACVEVAVPVQLGFGYHDIAVTARSARGESRGEQSLVVAPRRCYTVGELLGGDRLLGLWANLYTVRSSRNWGIGNLGDLGELLEFARHIGAGFVGLNPLHALGNRGSDVNPYRPVSRLYRNLLYLDVTAVPELAECTRARHLMAGDAFQARLHDLRGADHVQYEAIAALADQVLRALHQTFAAIHRGRDTDRGRDYARYVHDEGQALEDFATFQALQEHLNREGSGGPWPTWPAHYRDARSAEVRRFRERNRHAIDFHCYVQFELDRQLARHAAAARAAGMPVGLYLDVALGVPPDGSECWAHGDLFVTTASIGAPPDPFSQSGQNWGLAPLHPQRLAATRCRYWVELLRRSLAHAGALRLDHVMGLTRQFWIPAGRPASAGAYVRYPAEQLFGIVALESRRHGALIVGEDLGTVPPGFRDELDRWGVLSSEVLYFQRGAGDEFLPSADYSHRALVTVGTHDLVPLAGFWLGRDLELRGAVSNKESSEALIRARAQRELDRRRLLHLLLQEGLLDDENAPPYNELCAAVHAFLGRTPAPLVGLSLDDIAGETEPVNLPGVDPAKYPCWSRRMRILLRDLYARRFLCPGLAAR